MPTQTVPPQPKYLAYLALAGGVVCIGFAAIFVKVANTTGDVAGAWRLGVGTLVLSVPITIRWRRGNAHFPRKMLWMVIVSGLLLSVNTLLWNTAAGITTAANAALLTNIAPIWVGVGAMLLLGERLNPGYWLGTIVAMGGVVLVVGLDALWGTQINRGDALLLIESVGYAAYQLITKRVREEVDNLTYLWISSAVGALCLVSFTLLLRHPLVGYSVQSYLALLGLALLSHICGWLLISYAFGMLRASLVSVCLLGQPIITAVVALPILGEIPSRWDVVGGAVTLIGIYIVHRSIERTTVGHTSHSE
jgi:drug/metabolite transporter (DMT)-like permease